MKNTENYLLNKPETTDFFNVEDANANMDIIDRVLKEHSDDIKEVKANAKADAIFFDDTIAKTGASDVQGAIENVNSKVDANADGIATLKANTGYKKIIAGSRQLTFSDGSADLDLSATVTSNVIAFVQSTTPSSTIVIAGAQHTGSGIVKVGARKASDGSAFSGTMWVNYIVTGT